MDVYIVHMVTIRKQIVLGNYFVEKSDLGTLLFSCLFALLQKGLTNN